MIGEGQRILTHPGSFTVRDLDGGGGLHHGGKGGGGVGHTDPEGETAGGDGHRGEHL